MKHIIIVFGLFFIHFPSKSHDNELQLRATFDEYLKSIGDSTSVIRSKVDSEYNTKLELITKDSINPENIVAVIDSVFKNQYSFLKGKLVSCKSQYTVYSFQLAAEHKQTIVPCLERKLAPGCFNINIEITYANPFDSTIYILMLIPFIIAVSVWYFFSYKSNSHNETPYIAISKYRLYTSSQKMEFEKQVIELSDKEFKILMLLIHHKNETIERQAIQKEVWEDDGVIVGRSLDVFISKLRKKLSQDPNIEIKNVHGKGYRLIVGKDKN